MLVVDDHALCWVINRINVGPWNSYRMGINGVKTTASCYNQIDGEIFQLYW